MAKLKPWYDVVELREDLRENRPLDASEFAVHLDQIRDGRAPKDYTDPARFFDRTFVTGSLLELASQVVRRLSGNRVQTSAVFNMSTQFGGGKSHSLTALYHLAKHGAAANKWKGVERILERAEVKTVPEAAVAVFVGTEFDPLTGRGAAGEPKRKTIWGEIAWQLGGAAGFAAVAEHDAKGVAPGGDVIRKMLPDGPALILLDELLNYASRGRKIGARDQLINFLQNLSEEARGRSNLVVCVALPYSEDTEMNPDDVRDFQAMGNMLERVGKAIVMSADTEMAEIIRRRLFEWGGMPADGAKTAAVYAEWAVEHAQGLTGMDADTARDRFLTAYPFHPSVLSVFERKWQSLARFQRTRGVLRLLALWVAYNHREEHTKSTREPLITLGLAPLQDPTFRAAVFEQLGSNGLEVPVTTDIVGKADAHAVRLDREAGEAVRKGQLHRKAATTIFFESNGGMSQSKADASVPEIRTAVFGPETNLADLDEVLEALVGNCFYLNWDKNRYRFGLSPNLNQILVSRRGAVQAKTIDARVRQQTEKLFEKHTIDGSKHLDRKYWPAASGDVPNRPVLTLAVLGLDHPAGGKKANELMEAIVRDCGASGRTFKSAVLFAVPDGGETIRDVARNALAWEDIEDDEETKKRLDEGQSKQLKRNLDTARRELDEAIFRAYRHVYLLGKDNTLRAIDLGQITSSSAGSIGELILRDLQKSEEITDGVSPNKLVKMWPQGVTEWPTKAVRDGFYSSPKLARLLNPDAIRRTIADGVTQGSLGYATRGEGGRLKLERFKDSLNPADVDVSEDAFILKADDAVRLLEPPRIARLVLNPGQGAVNVGEQIAFVCGAVDQYEQPIALRTVTWSATGGEITQGGVFTAGPTGGLYAVRATSGDHETSAQVRVSVAKAELEETDEEESEEATVARVLRWTGTVPPQKWMTLYTKVLTRFASTPGLKITVSFEVPVDRDQAQSKADDARSGLKEVGLPNNVTMT